MYCWEQNLYPPTFLPSSYVRQCTDIKEKKIFLIYKEIQMGAAAKPYMRKGFLIYEEMQKFIHI
jgi:hypothetical protein